jgi:hypothetical protein
MIEILTKEAIGLFNRTGTDPLEVIILSYISYTVVLSSYR